MAKFGEILSSLMLTALQSVRLNAAGTAFEAYTPSDSGGFLIASDVLDYANVAAFPVTGVGGVVYNSLATGLSYRWDGSSYVLDTGNVASVFGRGGAVTAQAGDYTTALVPDTLNKRYVTDAEKASIAAVVAPIPCMMQVNIPKGENVPVNLLSESAYVLTITAVKKIVCSSGSITLDFKIDASSITGLNAVAVTTTTQDKVVTAGNVVPIGGNLWLNPSANAAATYTSFTIYYTRSLA